LDDKIKEYEKDSVCVNAGLAQLQPTVGPHNLLRTSLRGTLVHAYIKMRGGVEFTTTLFFTNNKLE
jgi:hypothetical protein